MTSILCALYKNRSYNFRNSDLRLRNIHVTDVKQSFFDFIRTEFLMLVDVVCSFGFFPSFRILK